MPDDVIDSAGQQFHSTVVLSVPSGQDELLSSRCFIRDGLVVGFVNSVGRQEFHLHF